LGALAPDLKLTVVDVWVKVSNLPRLLSELSPRSQLYLNPSIDHSISITREKDPTHIQGFPWSTTIIVRWTATMPGFTFTDDGSPYDNHGVHIIEMSWGNVTRIDANEDSQLVERYLKQRVSEGVVEAGLPPIES
jgi:hypothetical protein